MKANPLLVVGVIFAASFAGRAIGMANAALDRNDIAETAPSAPESVSAAPPEAFEDIAAAASAPETLPAPPDAAPVSAAHSAMQNGDLLKAIRERSATLDDQSAALEDRIRTLEIIEKRIDEKLVELRRSHSDLEKLVAYANEASAEDIALLAKMYEQMKPQKAGEIFDKMNPTFAAGFLTEMNSESAALILTNMSTDKAYEASMIIASRNAAVHQQ